MSGECEECGEHCLECFCKQNRPESITNVDRPFRFKQDKFAIIGGDIHILITKKLLEKLQKATFIPWFVEEDKDQAWIPLPDEKADRQKGRWVWVEYHPDKCETCKRKFFHKSIEG